MKLKTRLAMAFLTVTVLPMGLIYLAFWGLSHHQMNSFRKAYGLSEQVDLLSSNSVQVFNRLTRDSQIEIRTMIQTDPDKFMDPEFLETVNGKLTGKYAYLLVRRDGEIVFSGIEEQGEELYDRLPA